MLIDASLRRFPVVYIAAGSPRSAAPVTVEQLLAITGGEPCDLCTLGVTGSPQDNCGV